MTWGTGKGDASPERMVELDVLRGFALVGIALVNVNSLAGTAPTEGSTVSALIADFETYFVQGRFHPIFAFLFGVGFLVFVRNAERRGERPRPLFARRLAVLLPLGVAHQFLQPGEALLPYATFGFLLLPLYRVRSPILVALAVPFLGLGLFLSPELHIPGLFMLGTVCGRAGVFERPGEHATGLRRAALACLALSLAGLAFQWYVRREAERGHLVVPDTLLAMSVPGMPMAGLYVATLTLLLRHDAVLTLLRPLAAYGRTALTNYLAASLLLLGGAHLLRSLRGDDALLRVDGLLLCLALYAIQIPLSTWWLSRHRMGPLEWAWRTLTYGKAMPMRRTTGPAGDGVAVAA